MIKTLLWLVLLTCCSISCTNDNTKSAFTKQSKSDSGHFANNDTSCYSNISKFESNEFKLIQACHVIYSDSLSSSLISAYTGDGLPITLNFDKEDSSDLVFSRIGDTISVHILYMVNEAGYQVVPDSIYMRNEILFLKEKEIKPKNKILLKDYKFEEFYYKIFLKRKKIPPIRHIF